MTNIWIRSAASPNVYLRMDSSKVTGFNGAGSGTVNCQYYGAGSEPQSQAGNEFSAVLSDSKRRDMWRLWEKGISRATGWLDE